MNFFKSILSDESDIPYTEKPQHSSNEIDQHSPEENRSPDSSATGGGGWNFGGLIKTLATRSESVLETYRRDLQEFGSGLKNETVIFREAASRAVKELPASIEVGASVAHGSLESVGHAIIKSTAEIISHGKETLLSSSSDVESETPETAGLVSSSGRYSRFDAQLSAIQSDLSTFTEEPEDKEEYKKWKSEFDLEKKSDEVEYLTGENGVLEGVYRGVVPNVVDDETFWCRYFYRVHKLKQQESVRANLVRRAISIDDEEELSWDVDDDDNDDERDEIVKSGGDDESEKKAITDPKSSLLGEQELSSHESHQLSSGAVDTKIGDDCSGESQDSNIGAADAKSGDDYSHESHNESSGVVNEPLEHDAHKESAVVNEPLEHDAHKESAAEISKSNGPGNEDAKHEGTCKLNNEDEAVKEGLSEGKDDLASSGKDDGVSIVSTQQHVVQNEKVDEEELGWDEIEDVGSDDEKRGASVTAGGSQSNADARKRLSASEVDEDLSWDIEDDD